MPEHQKLPDNQITVYQTADGSINIEVLYANEKIWLTQKRMATLFEVDRSVITKHLKNIFYENELQEDSVCANFAHTAEDFSVVQTEGDREVLDRNRQTGNIYYQFGRKPVINITSN